MTRDARAAGRDLEMRLSYRHGMAPALQPATRPGEYPGSGDGTVDGPGLRGRIRWDLNELVGQTECQVFFSGLVETEDGATISFDSLGFGQVSDPAAAPSRWDVTAAVRLESDDPRYGWLTKQPAPWTGEFDMDTYVHRSRIAVPR